MTGWKDFSLQVVAPGYSRIPTGQYGSAFLIPERLPFTIVGQAYVVIHHHAANSSLWGRHNSGARSEADAWRQPTQNRSLPEVDSRWAWRWRRLSSPVRSFKVPTLLAWEMSGPPSATDSDDSTDRRAFESLQVEDARAIDGGTFGALHRTAAGAEASRIDYMERRYRRIIFWANPVPPVVQKIEEHVDRTSLERPARLLGNDEIYAILSDFQPCPGGMAARRVRTSSGPRG